MKNPLFYVAASYFTVALMALSASAEISTRLVLVSSEYDTPQAGQGTLVIDVEAINTSIIFPVGLFQGSFQLNATLHSQIVGTPTFGPVGQRQFEKPNYNYGENYDSGSRTVQYTYTYVSGTAKTIGGEWEQVVRVTIVYTMIADHGSISWADDPVYRVKGTGGVDRTGQRDFIPPDLVDISLPVELGSFTATFTSEVGVRVTWCTESETSCEGFHVWRSDGEDADYAQITSAMIPGHGDSPNAHDYTFVDRNVNEGNSYWYKLEQVDFDGAREFFGPIVAQSQEATIGLIPAHYALLQNFPNPFNPATEIRYDLPEESSVVLRIYNLLGEELRTLVNEAQPAGSHAIIWDGRADDGALLGSGVYFYKLVAGDYVKVRKMVKVE